MASGASGFSLEPAPAPTAPEEAAEPFLASWDGHEALPTPGAGGGPVLVGELRVCGDAGCDALAGGLAPGPPDLGWELGAGVAAVGALPGAPSSGRALRRKLSACSLRPSMEGASAAGGPGLGAAPGVWKNRSRACWVLEDDGVQAGVLPGTGDAGLKLSLVWGAVTRGVAQPCGVAGQGSGAHRVPVGRGLPAGDGHTVRELLVT